MKFKALILIGLLALLVAAPVSASITVTLQELGLAPQDIKVFNSTGGLIDTLNTTESIVLGIDNETFYTFQFQPNYTNRSPEDFLDTFFNVAEEHTIPLVILFGIVVVGAMALGRK